MLADREAGALNVCAAGWFVRTWPSMQLKFRVLDVSESGEKPLGEFVLDHHAS